LSPPTVADGSGRLALVALSAQLLTESASAAIRASDLLIMAHDPHARTLTLALARALADLLRVRGVVDARLAVVRYGLTGDQGGADGAAIDVSDGLAELQRREARP
jgi:hypothetical protein